MKLHGEVVELADLSSRDRLQMFSLMDRHYENVDRDRFEADLAEKRWVIQLWHPQNGALIGFSTQKLLSVTCGDRHAKALFSGDTIIDRAYWGDHTLQQLGGHLALSLVDTYPDCELYWFLISQGYKTYRFLPVFYREFYPRYDRPTPDHIRLVIDALASQKYPADYDRRAGVIRSGARQYRLREGVADLTLERLRDPHVRFFSEQNPGHASGDELCCLAPLTRANFTRAALRILNLPLDEADELPQPVTT